MRRTTTCLFLLLLPSTASAIPVRFIHSGAGSGFVGGASFNDADFVITAVANTDDTNSFDGGLYIDHDLTTIDIAGVGLFEFISPTRTFVNQDVQTVGLSRAGDDGADLYDGPNDAAFATWSMATSIGPIAGQTDLIQWDLDAVETSGGTLQFDTEFAIDGAFQAIVVPEPASALIASWLIAGALLAAQRKRDRSPLKPN